jgi:hypothetical protein
MHRGRRRILVVIVLVPSRLDPILIHTSGIGTDMGTHLEMEKYGRNNHSPRILV